MITPQGDWLGPNWSLRIDLDQKRPIQWMIERDTIARKYEHTSQERLSWHRAIMKVQNYIYLKHNKR